MRAWGLLLVAALGGCGGGNDGADDAPIVDMAIEDGSGASAGTVLPAGDFAALALGAKIDGQAGPTPSGPFGDAGAPLGSITSYVACPAGAEACVPDEREGPTVYTYVHTVTPARGATSFRTAQPVHGFTGRAGFDRAQARAALGPEAELRMRCVNGALVWSVTGDGEWSALPVTFYWQSRAAPAGPAPAGYQLVHNGEIASGPGPAPPDLSDPADPLAPVGCEARPPRAPSRR